MKTVSTVFKSNNMFNVGYCMFSIHTAQKNFKCYMLDVWFICGGLNNSNRIKKTIPLNLFVQLRYVNGYKICLFVCLFLCCWFFTYSPKNLFYFLFKSYWVLSLNQLILKILLWGHYFTWFFLERVKHQ